MEAIKRLMVVVTLSSIALLAACNPPLQSDELPSCPPKGDGSHQLCMIGVRTIFTASCDDLLSTTFLEHLICKTGLGPLGERTAGIYGARSLHCVRSAGGLCQQPAQLAGALVALAPKGVSSYVELGIANGATAVFVTTYLRRFAPGNVWHGGYAIDITHEWITGPTRALLKTNKIELEIRRPPPHMPLGKSIDLCFIDANHRHYAVRDDFAEFKNFCKITMYHDIADMDSAMVDNNERGYTQGVARFWADVTANAEPGDYVEFMQTPGAFPATLGIGIIVKAHSW